MSEGEDGVIDQNVHPLVVELVLERLEPIHLLNCRLVNYLWNGIATDLLHRTGRWNVWLRSGVDCIDYVRSSGFHLLQLNSSLPRIRLGLRWCPATLPFAIRISRQSSESDTKFQILVVTVTVDAGSGTSIETQLLEFLELNADSLREIDVHISCNDNSGASGCPEEVVSISHLRGLEFPSLKSIRLGWSLGLQLKEPPPIFAALVARAPNLVSIHIRGDDIPPSLMQMLTLTSVGLDTPSKLTRLQELDISLQEESLQLLDGFQFSHLRVLRISCTGFAILGKVIQFVGQSCPVLSSVEIKDVTTTETTALEAPRRSHLPSLHHLPRLTHFGFYLAELLAFRSDTWVRSSVLADVEAIHSLMSPYHNLTRVSTNLEGCTAAAKLFTSHGGNFTSEQFYIVPPFFEHSIWPKVTRLNLSVSDSALGIYAQNGAELRFPQCVAWLITKMYPNLEEVVVTLERSMDSSTRRRWPRRRPDFEYVLDIVRHVRVSRLEVNNWGPGWELTGPTPTPSRAIESQTNTTENHNRNPVWKVFTIRGQPKKTRAHLTQDDDKSLPEPKSISEEPPILVLDRFLELLPSGSDFLIRVDARILPLGQESYAETEKRFQTEFCNPRVELL